VDLACRNPKDLGLALADNVFPLKKRDGDSPAHLSLNLLSAVGGLQSVRPGVPPSGSAGCAPRPWGSRPCGFDP
jgi:hypothetical protein